MTRHFARLFDCPLTVEQIRARFNELGPWTWRERDNDRWGDYMSTAPFGTQHAMVKVLHDGTDWAINVYFFSDLPEAETQYLTMHETLFERLLPAVGATNFRSTETYE